MIAALTAVGRSAGSDSPWLVDRMVWAGAETRCGGQLGKAPDHFPKMTAVSLHVTSARHSPSSDADSSIATACPALG